MKSFVPFGVGLAALVCGSLMATESARAQGDGDVEAKFVAMLKNATLKGSWAPVQQGNLGGGRETTATGLQGPKRRRTGSGRLFQ